MINKCFAGKANSPKTQPRAKKLTSPPSGNGFESRAFNSLYANAADLKIKAIFKCASARMDGYLILENDEIVLLEIKETLNWTSIKAATFQLLAGRKLLGFNSATRGIIVFEKSSAEWDADFKNQNGTWGQFALHAEEVSEHITIGAMQVNNDGTLLFPS